jgi:hypothetical protein
MFTQALLASWALVVAPDPSAGMNGNYLFANPVSANGTSDPFPAGGAPAPAFRGKFIDVYTDNITTVYSQVFWTDMPPVPLPADFVARFAGKVVSITGYEADMVRVQTDGSEIHVPLFEQYNHHHNAYVVGKAAAMVHVGPGGVKGAPSHGGMPMTWVPRPLPSTNGSDSGRSSNSMFTDDSQAPEFATAAFIVDGNGGEYRKSRHGTATGFGILVQSPATFSIQPMNINTRDPNSTWPFNTKGPTTDPSLLPKGARSPPGADYSGLLECPCTDRKPRRITNHNTREAGVCADAHGGTSPVASAAACFQQVSELGLLPVTKNFTGAVADAPSGCFVRSTRDGYEATFNTDERSTVPCGPANASAPVRAMGAVEVAGTGVSAKLALDGGVNCTPPTVDLSGTWAFGGSPAFPSQAPYRVTFSKAPEGASNSSGGSSSGGGGGGSGGGGGGGGVVEYKVVGSSTVCNDGKGCRGTFDGKTFRMTSGFVMAAPVASDFSSMTFTNTAEWTRTKACAGAATITLRGPSDFWFGLGFGSTGMTLGTYAFVVDGNTGSVTERALGDHNPGQLLPASVRVASNSVAGGVRTVVLTRAAAGASPQHYSFSETAAGVPVIGAVGAGPSLAYHRARSATTLMLVEVGGPMCVCVGGVSGSIDGRPFNNHCEGQPNNLWNVSGYGKNDICDIRTYNGGLKCCSHNSILLDKAQAVPTQNDTYKMKFRIWYEDYVVARPQSHAFFMFRTNEVGAGEYDVPQCAAGTPPEECVYTTTGTFRVRDSMRKCASLADPWCAPNWNESSDVLLLRAGAHCHAPSCINETLYNNATGEVVCFNRPLYGEGKEGDFDETAYATGIPPCMWGPAEDGLLPPPRFKLDTVLRSVKHCNNTNYHYGVMAQWQMRGAFAPPL